MIVGRHAHLIRTVYTSEFTRWQSGGADPQRLHATREEAPARSALMAALRISCSGSYFWFSAFFCQCPQMRTKLLRRYLIGVRTAPRHRSKLRRSPAKCRTCAVPWVGRHDRVQTFSRAVFPTVLFSGPSTKPRSLAMERQHCFPPITGLGSTSSPKPTMGTQPKLSNTRPLE